MTTQTPHTGLIKATLQDPFVVNDIAANWDRADAYPGEFICTSTTRPNWGAQNAGQSIAEIDSGFSWKWTGTAFTRRDGGGSGMLKTSSGGLAISTRPVDFVANTNPPTYAAFLAVTGVVVPPGNRPIKITVTVSSSQSNIPTWFLGLFRSEYSNSGTQEREWVMSGTPQRQDSRSLDLTRGPYRASGDTLVAMIPGGLPPGIYAWSIQLKNVNLYPAYMNSTVFDGNNNTVPGAAPIAHQITVEEM